MIPKIVHIQSSTEFDWENTNYNKRFLIHMSAAAPAAISIKEKRINTVLKK